MGTTSLMNQLMRKPLELFALTILIAGFSMPLFGLSYVMEPLADKILIGIPTQLVLLAIVVGIFRNITERTK